jgi:hypothetical protein
VVALLAIRVDNATPIVMNREKSVTLGILGTLALWRSTKLSLGMGELCADAALMRTQEFDSWISHNGCSIPWPAARMVKILVVPAALRMNLTSSTGS